MGATCFGFPGLLPQENLIKIYGFVCILTESMLDDFHFFNSDFRRNENVFLGPSPK